MKKLILKISKRIIYVIVILLITIYFVRAFDARGHMQLRDEHRITLEQEYNADMEGYVNWSEYLELESKLSDELASKINTGSHSNRIDRHVPGSPANPNSFEKNWNHSYVMKPDIVSGAAVLLHGLTDSPYSVRATAELFRDKGFIAYAPRMPGHGFAVGSLRQATWQDWVSVTKMVMREADKQRKPEQPLILVGYSNGGLLAVRYTIECMKDPELPCPDGLILISAAIEVTPFALLANLHSLTSWLPYFGQFQWESISPEIDPFKFTSFPKKPGWEIYQLVKEVEKGLVKLQNSKILFPPTIAFQSLVDDTVNSHAAINFIRALPENHHELVLYDVNRNEIMVEFMNQEPPNLNAVIRDQAPFEFSISVITNRDPYTQEVHALELEHGNKEPEYMELNQQWPRGVFSLSHIALPFPMDDPVYGSETENVYNLGMLAPRGERGVLNLSPNYFMRLRHNPFFDYKNKRITNWLEKRK